ncbi:MAG: hypothetical protein Kow0025_07880 [Thermodesulfovibrionales bacterium]
MDKRAATPETRRGESTHEGSEAGDSGRKPRGVRSELIKVCAWCKRVRDEGGDWKMADIEAGSSAGFTHGICPVCMERVRTESDGYIGQNR